MKISFFTSILLFAVSTAGCQSPCELKGTWNIKEGQMTRNHERSTRKFSKNRIEFSKDSVTLSSGFFYDILDVEAENLALGRFPFVFYGKKEKYKIVGDSVYIYSTPYELWDSYKMTCVKTGEIILVGRGDSITLVKNSSVDAKKTCTFTYIKAHVYELGLGLYNIDYTLEFQSSDKLFYKETKGKSTNDKTIELIKGTFKEICHGFDHIDVQNLKYHYPTPMSEMTVVELEIGLKNGTVFRTKLENDDYPEDLYFALVPVMFGHQRFIYSDLPPIGWGK